MGLFDLFKGGNSRSSGASSSSSQKPSVASTSTNQVPSAKKTSTDPIEALSAIHSTVSILEKKLEALEEKVKSEHNKAKEHATSNKNLALAALKRKKNYETQLETIQKSILRLEEQAMQLETVSLNVETTFALKKSLEAQKFIQAKVSIEDMETIVDDLREFQDKQKEIDFVMQSLENTEHEEDINEELNNLIEERISEDLLAKMPAAPPVKKAEVPLVEAFGKKSVQNLDAQSVSAADEEAELEELKRSLALWINIS